MQRKLAVLAILLLTPVLSLAALKPVYRFWSPVYQKQFLTLSRIERDNLIAKDKNWRYDGIAFYAHDGPEEETVPLYRFWSPVFKSHFYTTSEKEKDKTIENPEWNFEGTAFHVYPFSSAQPETMPVFRLWSREKGGHFYTTFLAEKEILDAGAYRYEFRAFRAFPSHAGKKFAGVHMPPFQNSWDGAGPFNDYLKKGLVPFNGETGKEHTVVMFFAPWQRANGEMFNFGAGNPKSGQQFEAGWIAQQIVDSGATPMITWEPFKAYAGLNQPEFQLERIASGGFDSYLTTYARDIKQWGHTVLLRVGHEMNGDYYPWSCSLNGDDPELYARAFRHIVEIFKREGADNAKFVWSPNYASPPQVSAACQDLDALYPGDDVVDYIGVSAYNWGKDTSRGPGWVDLEKLLAGFLEEMAVKHPDKVVIVSETGVAHDASDEEIGRWLKNAYEFLALRGNVAGIVYFNDFAYSDPNAADFRVTTGPVWDQYPVSEGITGAYKSAVMNYFPW